MAGTKVGAATSKRGIFVWARVTNQETTRRSGKSVKSVFGSLLLLLKFPDSLESLPC